MSPSEIPDEIWRSILQLGVNNSILSHKDLCCLSISCKRLRRLSGEDTVWSFLLASDFPNQLAIPSESAKHLYKIRFEREREHKLRAHRRAVLRKESQIAEHSSKFREIEARIKQEKEKLKSTAVEMSNLHKVRQASVALHVWQPEIVRGKQKQIVQQCVVPIESRVHALEMEVKLCKKQIAVLDKASRNEKQRLRIAKEELESMNYHPLRDCMLRSGENNVNVQKKKIKKMSISINGNVNKSNLR